MTIDLELKQKLLKADSFEQIKELLQEQVSEKEAEQIWNELQNRRPAATKTSLDDEELESVAGGADRDFSSDGCAATVEEGSWCGSNDYCNLFDVTYTNFDPCPQGGNHEWTKVRGTLRRCAKCGAEFEVIRMSNNTNV